MGPYVTQQTVHSNSVPEMPTVRVVYLAGEVWMGGGVSGSLQGLPVPASFFLPPWERGVCRKCRIESLGSDDGRWGDTA